jgi:peptidyl-Lys metalloendopeptidase
MNWRSIAFLIWIGVTFALSAAAQSPEAHGLTACLTVETPEVHAQGPLTVRFTLTNTSGRDVTILKWHTPLEGFRSDMFRVERNGHPAGYLGILVKRVAPTAEDMVTIPKGGSVSAAVDLFKGYDIFEPGDYTVQFAATIYVAQDGIEGLSRPDYGLVPGGLRSSTAHFKLLEPRTPSAGVSRPLSRPAQEPGLRFGVAPPPTFMQCADYEIKDLNEARDNAQLLAAWGSIQIWLSPLSKKPNIPYQTWFGDYDATRYNQVGNNFNAIYNALAHEETLTFHCDDTSEINCRGAYAWVNPRAAFNIHVCPAYWRLPPTGLESKADVIVHETSHFNVVAGTTDKFANGPAECMDLAKRDPDKAIQTADSYSFFADTVTPPP